MMPRIVEVVTGRPSTSRRRTPSRSSSRPSPLRAVLGGYGEGQWPIRVLIALGALVVVLAVLLAGGSLPIAVLVAFTLLIVAGVLFAHTWPVGVLVVALVGGYALLATDPLSPAAVLAASGALAVHLCGALAEATPRQAAIPPALIRRFLLPWVLGTAAAALTWATAALAGFIDLPAGLAGWVSLVALVALTVVVVLALASVGPRSERRR